MPPSVAWDSRLQQTQQESDGDWKSGCHGPSLLSQTLYCHHRGAQVKGSGPIRSHCCWKHPKAWLSWGTLFFFPLCQGNNCPFRKIKQKQKQYPEGPSLYVSLGLTISETGLCLMLEISLTWWTDLYSARKLSTWLDATSGLVDHWLFLYFSDKIFGKKSNWRRQGLFWLTVEWVAHHSRKVMATAAWDNRLHCLLVRKKEMAAAGLTFPFLIGPGPQPMAQFCLHWG